MIGIEKIVDRNPEHMNVLNGLSVNTIEVISKYSNTSYEINDGRIIGEIEEAQNAGYQIGQENQEVL